MQTILAVLLAAAMAGSGAPDARLASTFIGAGGGAGSFSTIRAFDRMLGPSAVIAQERLMRVRFGSRDADRFFRMFTYAVSDAWTRASRANIRFPNATSQSGSVSQARRLIRAGVSREGSFDTTHLFAQLFSLPVAIAVMNDLDAKYGQGSSQTFAREGDRFFENVGSKVGVSVKVAAGG